MAAGRANGQECRIPVDADHEMTTWIDSARSLPLFLSFPSDVAFFHVGDRKCSQSHSSPSNPIQLCRITVCLMREAHRPSSFVHIARGATRPSASSAAAVAANFLFPADLILPPSVSLPPSFPLPFAMDGLDVLAQCEGPPQKFAKRVDDGDKSLVSAIILCFG